MSTNKIGINKSYAVFGLGQYGSSVAKELAESGVDVIGVDCDMKIVEDLISFLPICKCADVTDPEVIKQLGISNIDVVVIAISGDLEASIMATMLCKEAGVEQVIVKCCCELHKTIIKKVGADVVVLPEQDFGIRLAKNILSSGFVDIADVSENILIAELDARDEWIGKTIREIDLRKKYAANVIAVNLDGKTEITINPDMKIEEGMTLIVIADKKDISNLK